jgi:hypothetical protein
MLLQSTRMDLLSLKMQMTTIRANATIVATEIGIAMVAETETEIENEGTAAETDLAGRQMVIKS